MPYHTLLFAGVEPPPSVRGNVSTIAQELHRRAHRWFEIKFKAYKSLLIKLHTETTEACDQLLGANTCTKDIVSHFASNPLDCGPIARRWQMDDRGWY